LKKVSVYVEGKDEIITGSLLAIMKKALVHLEAGK